MEIIWGNPKALLGLWLLVPLAALLIYGSRKRKKAALQFAEAKMVERLMPTFESSRPWFKGSLVLLGLLCLGVAAGRPRWGEYFETVQQRGADVMVVLDVSKSMLSVDVAPNRLDRAKSDIRDLLKHIRGERIGLIVFAGKGILACPLTTDHGFFTTVLDEVGPHSAPRGGSLIGDAIREALRSMEDRRDRDQAILLITDGEDQDSYPKDAASLAKERGVKLIAIGLGDPDTGSRIPIIDDSGNVTYVKHNGQEVWSRLDEDMLKELRLIMGGVYIPARTSVYDLGEVYDSHVATLSGSEVSAQKRKRYLERFQVFLGMGLVLIFLELLISRYPKKAVAGIAILLAMGLPVSSYAGDAVNQVKAGITAFDRGDFEEAKRLFQEADISLPENEVIGFARGAVYQAFGESDEAKTLYRSVTSSRDLELAIRSRYNLGTLAADEGRQLAGEDPSSLPLDKREPVREALYRGVGHFRSCLELDVKHADSRHNIEVIRLWLKNMEDVWAQKDLEEKREELDLLAFLTYLMERQSALRVATLPISDLADSPKSREARRQLGERQRELYDEIQPLKGKIQEQFDQMAEQMNQGAPPGGTGAPSGPDPQQIQQAVDQFQTMSDEAGQAMLAAADDLEGGLFTKAVEAQKKSRSILEDIWNAMSPFDQTLKAALETHEPLTKQSKAHLEERLKETSEDPGKTQVKSPEERKTEGRFMENQSESEGWVSKLAGAFVPKAEMMQKQLPPEDSVSEPPPDETEEQKQQREASEEQTKALRAGLEKAIENGPRIRELADIAKNALLEDRLEDAVPAEEEALKLLQEIADLMPKDENEDQQDQENDEQKEDDQEQEQDQQEPEDQEDQGEKEQPSPSEQQQEMTPQQAEALLQKAMEQERDAKDRRRRAMSAFGSKKVDRDW